MKKKLAAVGFRVHSGWAAMVVVGARPEIILRRRIDIVDRKGDGVVQPYHAVVEMPLKDAEKHIARCAADARERAGREIERTIADLAGCRIVACAMTLSSGRPMSTLEATLRSHPAIHTAEGEHFRTAIRGACEDCGFEIAGVKEKELVQEVAALGPLTKVLGPPWTQDEKLAALVAWRALATYL